MRWVCGCCSSAFRESQILPMYVGNTPLSSHPLRVCQVSSIREILGVAVYSWRTATVFLTSRVGPDPGGRCAATAGRVSACLWTPNCCFTGSVQAFTDGLRAWKGLDLVCGPSQRCGRCNRYQIQFAALSTDRYPKQTSRDRKSVV